MIARGHAAGETGGHVGFATGETRVGSGGQTQVQVISGNEGNRVATSFVDANAVTLRRASEATATGASTPQLLGATPASIKDMDAELAKQREQINLNIEAWKGFGIEQQLNIATQQADTVAKDKGFDTDHRLTLEQLYRGQVLEKAGIETDRQTKFEELHAQGLQNTVDGYRASEVAGIQANAVMAAGNETLQRNSGALRTWQSTRNAVFLQSADVSERATQNLIKEALTAAGSAQRQVAALDPAIAANQRLATASESGTAAERDMAIHNQALTLTHNALTIAIAAHQQAVSTLAKAETEGNQKLIEKAQAQVASTQQLVDDTTATTENAEAQLKRNAALQEATSLNLQTQRGKDEGAILQLETDLQGRTTEQIRTQVDLLKAKQTIVEHHVNTLDPEAAAAQQKAEQSYLAQVNAVGDLNIKLQEAEREQSRLNSAVSNVANTIQNQIGTALDNAFSGQKAQSWGDTMKTILRDLLKQIVEFTLIQPAIGTALGALGFSQVAQQFGSFGNLVGVLAGRATIWVVWKLGRRQRRRNRPCLRPEQRNHKRYRRRRTEQSRFDWQYIRRAQDVGRAD